MYAGFWRRAFALFVDGIILAVINFFVNLAFGLFVSGTNTGDTLGAGSFVIIFIALIILALIPIFYFAGFESSSLQATPGKLVIGIKVTDMQGNRIGFLHAVCRTLGKIISNLILNIGYAMAGFTVMKQALHDKLAGTLVLVKEADASAIAPLPAKPAGTIAILVFAALLPNFIILAFLFLISIPQYSRAVSRSQAVEGLLFLGQIAASAERYRLSSRDNSYPMDFSRIDFDMSLGGTPSPYERVYDNFTYTLGPSYATAKRGNEYVLTRCYESGAICCDGNKTVCEKIGLPVLNSAACCLR